MRQYIQWRFNFLNNCNLEENRAISFVELKKILVANLPTLNIPANGSGNYFSSAITLSWMCRKLPNEGSDG